MITYRDFVSALRSLRIDHDKPVIVHASHSAFGEVLGGAETLLGALLSIFDSLLMPAFTYATMVVPETGPADNGIEYGSSREENKSAVVFHPEMPVDREMGAVAEAFRRHPRASRSLHPILSFSGVNVSHALDAQTYVEPLAPIRVLTEAHGWVLLMGVDHTSNISIHYAERLAGRRQFIRWALTHYGVRQCSAFPGCSQGFQEIAPLLEGVGHHVELGGALVQAFPLVELIGITRSWINRNPLALLCGRADCLCCNAIRRELEVSG